MKKEIRKIGIITGGGDCSGLNAVINGITKTAVKKYGVEVVGFTKGYHGLIKNNHRPLGLKTVSGILHEGGTILKSSNKDNLFNYRIVNQDGTVEYKDVSDEAVKNLKVAKAPAKAPAKPAAKKTTATKTTVTKKAVK